MTSIKFYKETNFKETPIGKIPKDWEIIKLGDTRRAKIIMGQSPPSSTYNKDGEGLPFLQGKLEFGMIYPSPTVYCSQPLKIAEKSDILISVRAPVGDVNIAPYRLCIGRGLAAIRFDSKEASSWFYFYYLQKIKHFLENLGKGSTFKAINKGDLEDLRLPFPPLSEQHEIAEVLYCVDFAIQRVDEAIARAERLKKGLMQHLLTKGIGHKEYKETPIGKIPKQWEVKKIDDLFKVETGTTPSTKEPQYWNEGNINWFTPVDLSKLNEKILIKESIRKITQKALKECNLTLMPRGSIILSTRAPVGYVAVLGKEGTFNQGCKGLLPKKEKRIYPFFYAYYLLLQKQRLENLSGGSTFKELSKNMLEKFKVPYPQLKEQQKIAEILSTVDKKLELERSRKARLERIK
ncbi:restriction endonuclease subunit S, partial [Methanosarcinales archaeon]